MTTPLRERPARAIRSTLDPVAAPGDSSLGRAAALLSAFGPGDGPLTVSELARRADLPKSSVSRMVRQLVALGFLERAGRGLWLGIRLFELGELAARPRSLRRLALPQMADLRSATHCTVHLAVLDRRDVVYLEILDARGAPPLVSRIGGRAPAHATSVGKALLAYAPSSVVDAVIAQGLPRLGPRTITSGHRLLAELAAIRERGIAYENEESGEGVCCAGSAIVVGDKRAVAAISVSGPRGQVDLDRVGPVVHLAALSLGRAIGSRVI